MSGAAEAAAAARSAALDPHKGLPAGGCPRWPADLRLESTLGDLVPGRCKATNQCDYCAKLAARENAELLAQDALTNSAPEVWAVLTTRSTIASMAEYARAREAVLRAVKREWATARRATMIEFTTGLGTRSEGKRRPHWNDVWKGIPPADAEQLHAVISEAWCKRVDARPEGQYVGLIRETGGLMRYLALHFQKESQQPPKGWRGQRFNVGRGYLAEPMEQARERARRALRLRRELWRAEQQGLEGEQALRAAELAVWEGDQLAWSLVRQAPVVVGWDATDYPILEMGWEAVR